MRAARRRAVGATTGRQTRYQNGRFATMWKVPTTGARAAQTAVMPAAGSIGSCTWTTSNRRART